MPVLDPTVAGNYTVGYLIDRTFDMLLASARQEVNRLGAPGIDDVVDTIPLDFEPKSVSNSTFIAIDDEIMYVWASQKSSGTSSTATVQRGQKGTVAVSHDAGAMVYVNPYFTRPQVRATLRDEIRSWGPQLYQVKSLDITHERFVSGYDLAGINYHFIIDLLGERPFNHRRDRMDWRSVSFRSVPSAPTSDFPSGEALIITDPRPVHGSLHLVYAAPFDVDTTFNDDDALNVMGIDASDVDIAPLGAAWRLAASREVRRSLFEAQGVAGDLQNTPPGYLLAAADKFKALRDSRIDDGIRRLLARNPIRRRA